MFKNLKPDLAVANCTQIPFDFLEKHCVKGLLIDVDNTIAKDGAREIDPAAKQFILKAMDRGIRVCLMSNNVPERIAPLADELGCQSLGKAGKPKKQAYLNAANEIGLDVADTAMIGDQLFTDIWGANKMGIPSILVRPIDKNEIITIRLKRPFEKIVLFFHRIKR